MRILTLDNQTYHLDKVPDEIEEDIRFSVLDNSDPKSPDFFFVPLIFLESFSAPAMVLDIGGNEITMPLDWCIAVGDSESGNDLEVLPLTSYTTSFTEVKIVNFYNDVKWYFPKMKNGQLLSVPIKDGTDPKCAFFVKDISRQSETIDYAALL